MLGKAYVDQKYVVVRPSRRVKLQLQERIGLESEYEMYHNNLGDFIYYQTDSLDTSNARFLLISQSDRYCTVELTSFGEDDKVNFRPEKSNEPTKSEYEVDKSYFIGKQARIGFIGDHDVSLIELERERIPVTADTNQNRILNILPLILSSITLFVVDFKQDDGKKKIE